MNTIDLLKPLLKTNKKIVIEPQGSSMKPFLLPGDRVTIVSPDRPLKKYDVVLYRSRGVNILHRIIGEKDSQYIICGDNSSVLEFVGKNQIFGVAVFVERNEKVYSLDRKVTMFWIKAWYEFGLKELALCLKRRLRGYDRRKQHKTKG